MPIPIQSSEVIADKKGNTANIVDTEPDAKMLGEKYDGDDARKWKDWCVRCDAGKHVDRKITSITVDNWNLLKHKSDATLQELIDNMSTDQSYQG